MVRSGLAADGRKILKICELYQKIRREAGAGPCPRCLWPGWQPVIRMLGEFLMTMLAFIGLL